MGFRRSDWAKSAWRTSFCLLWAAVCLVTCGKEPEDARQTLERMHIPYSDASFVEQVIKGDTTTTRPFLSAGMSANLRTRDGRPVLSLAALMGRTAVAEILLTGGADANARDARGTTALAHGAAAGHVEVVRLLLDRGPTPMPGTSPARPS